jgi:hypothetical protein
LNGAASRSNLYQQDFPWQSPIFMENNWFVC